MYKTNAADRYSESIVEFSRNLLRILPFAAGIPLGDPIGNFSILNFAVDAKRQQAQPPVVYLENYVGDLYLEKPHDVERQPHPDPSASEGVRRMTDLTNARWFKSTRSSGGKDCVEVAFLDNGPVATRDSKNPTGPALIFTTNAWSTFTTWL